VNDLCFTHLKLKRTGQFFSAYDVAQYTVGASKAINLHSQTIQAVTEELVSRRKQFKKAKLNWRVSNQQSARRSLGWIPFKKSAVKVGHGFVQYGKTQFKLWDSYGLEQYHVKTGCFVEDARGRWYVCLVVDNAPKLESKGTESIGIELGLKDLATLSNGQKLAAPQHYRCYEQKLGIAQRARKKNRVRAIHAKIKNMRHNQLHQFSTELVKAYAAIVIGNVSSNALTQTKLAKSILDAGWSSFKTMLRYKCANARVWFEEVSERYTIQACSCCGSISPNSPKGRAGLGIREWICPECGAVHDRDVNGECRQEHSRART
jgi:IS605 OrfB family transposase